MAESSISNLYTIPTRRTKQLLQKAKLTENGFLIILAVGIGILAGATAVGLRTLILEISNSTFSGEGSLLENIIQAPWYIKLGIPAAGALLVGPLIYFGAKEAKGHGVPEVMESITLRSGIIRPRVVFIKAIASALTIGSGGSVGREGPVVQIGAGIGSTIGQLFKIPGKRLKILAGSGAAAGLAAAFNAPIAGAIFAAEILIMDFSVSAFAPIVIAAVTATVVSHTISSGFVAFTVPAYQLVSPTELIFYVILGLLGGVISFLFIKSLYITEDFFDNRLKIPGYIKPLLGGIAIGGIAFVFPQVLGVGYESVDKVLRGDIVWELAAALVFVKIVATSLSLGSGASGGIWSPSLMIGAMLGVAFGSGVHSWFPELTASPGAYALVAMGGVIAGATRAPLTAIIIVFELTNNYNIILPLMITCIISTLISAKFSHESIYTLKLMLRGVKVEHGLEKNIIRSIQVKDVYSEKYDPIFAQDNFNQIVNKIIRGKGPEFPVLEQRAEILGFISIHDVKDYLFEKDSLADLLIASDISDTEFETLQLTDDCDSALQKLQHCDMEGLPVVDSENPKKIIGMVWKRDILDEYQKEVERRELTSSLAKGLSPDEYDKNVQFAQGYQIAEIEPPQIFMDKSIKQLRIRSKYGCDVLSVKSKTDGKETMNLLPGSDYKFKDGDIIIVAGEARNIKMLKNLF